MRNVCSNTAEKVLYFMQTCCTISVHSWLWIWICSDEVHLIRSHWKWIYSCSFDTTFKYWLSWGQKKPEHLPPTQSWELPGVGQSVWTRRLLQTHKPTHRNNSCGWDQQEQVLVRMGGVKRWAEKCGLKAFLMLTDPIQIDCPQS